MAKQKSNRAHLVALIHAQKNAAHLDDDAYRAIVYGATGEESCTDCTIQQLHAVFTDLNIVLEKHHKKPFIFRARFEKPDMRDAITARAKKLLGENWQDRLALFVQTKLQKQSLADCSEADLRRVMGFLSGVERGAK